MVTTSQMSCYAPQTKSNAKNHTILQDLDILLTYLLRWLGGVVVSVSDLRLKRSLFDSGLYHSGQQLWAGCVHLLAQWGVMLWPVISCDKHCVVVLGRLFTHRSGCPGQLSLPSLPGWQMSTSFGWEGKGRYGSFRLQINWWVCR